MQRLIVALLAVSAVGVVVGHSIRGSWASGLILGAMVAAAAWEWWRLRRGTDTPDAADRLGIYIVFLASALAAWPEVEAWFARVLD